MAEVQLYIILFRFFGLLKIENGGTYEFKLTSDDGSLLFINGELVRRVGCRQNLATAAIFIRLLTTITIMPPEINLGQWC